MTTCAGRDVKIHIWDFGGQEIMHATHQFFLSQRSLYILVLDGRKEQDPEYWLKHIESFGGDSPILVVLNKVDENPSHDVNRLFLQRKYPGVAFYRVSAKENTGIAYLRRALGEALERVEILNTPWPGKWFAVKERLEGMDDSFISYDKYVDICDSVGLDVASTQETLVQFLHDLGVIVHFADFRLSDTHVLEPRWLTTAVYRIINSQTLADSHGVLELESLSTILEDSDGQAADTWAKAPSLVDRVKGVFAKRPDGFTFPKSKHPYIIDLMKKFQLCYPLGEDRVLIPDLLAVQEPKMVDDFSEALLFRIDYDFLPKSVIARFIVRMHSLIKNGLQWRSGVVLEDPGIASTAVVRVDYAAKRIEVQVIGDRRREFLTVIRSAFLDIRRGYEKLKATERVPLPDNPEVAVSFKHLLLLEQKGDETFIPDGADRPYRVDDLLGSLFIKQEVTQQQF